MQNLSMNESESRWTLLHFLGYFGTKWNCQRNWNSNVWKMITWFNWCSTIAWLLSCTWRLLVFKWQGWDCVFLVRSWGEDGDFDYGDPGVLKLPDNSGYLSVVSSGMRVDAFPLLFSPDLVTWSLKGHVFPNNSWPSWAEANMWAPEVHFVNDK